MVCIRPFHKSILAGRSLTMLELDSAASAVRNLNDHEIMGRKLRVDFSNETVSDEDNRDRDGQACSFPLRLNRNFARLINNQT